MSNIQPPDGTLPIVDALPPSIYQVCPPNPLAPSRVTEQAIATAGKAVDVCHRAYNAADAAYLALTAKDGNPDQQVKAREDLHTFANLGELDTGDPAQNFANATKAAQDASIACRYAEGDVIRHLLDQPRPVPGGGRAGGKPLTMGMKVAEEATADAERAVDHSLREYLAALVMADAFWEIVRHFDRYAAQDDAEDAPIGEPDQVRAALNAAANRANAAIHRTADAINAGGDIAVLGLGKSHILGPTALAIVKGSVTATGRLSDALLAVHSAEQVIAKSDGVMSSDEVAAALNIVHLAAEAVQDAAKESAAVAALCGQAFDVLSPSSLALALSPE